MGNSSGSWAPENPVNFRAPPPSPIAAGIRSSVANEEVLTDFLEHSLRVPHLVLPDKFFPRQKSTITPQKIDYQLLDFSSKNDSIADVIIDSVLQTGCFQLISHGIDKGLIRSVLARAMGIFRLPNDEKAAISRSKENNLWGFEDVHSSDDDVNETSEEFVWCKDERLQLKMESIWPNGYSKFSEKMETLSSRIEQIGAKIVRFLELHDGKCWSEKKGKEVKGFSGSISYLYKHCRHNVSPAPAGEGLIGSLRYDVVRMLIRGSDHSHALCFHLVNGCSEFHVYSKKGWVSFSPEKDSLIVTFGDQMQVNNNISHHVMGRPIFNNGVDQKKENDAVSIAIVCSPPDTITTSINSISRGGEENSISIGQQLRILILLFLLFQLLVSFLSYEF